MSETHSITQMAWQPPLLKLTLVGNPQVDDGIPLPVFIIPQSICSIHRGIGAHGKFLSNPTEWLEPFHCTVVKLSNGDQFQVMESPEKVARCRDEAMGHKWQLVPV